MVARIAARLVHSIEDDYFMGKKPFHIAQRHPEVHHSTVYRICSSLSKFGAAYPIHRWAPLGRPRVIVPSIELELLELLTVRSTYYLDELQYYILINHGLWVSESTVSRAIKHGEFTRKVKQRIAAQRDEEKRNQFWLDLEAYEANQLAYVDESAANEKTLDRKYGWAPRGLPAIDIQVLHRSTRWSILPALTINGYLEGTLIVQGSVTGEMFANWLEEIVLPQCNPYPGPQSVLIMDNCSTHHVAVIFNKPLIFEQLLTVDSAFGRFVIKPASFSNISLHTRPTSIRLSLPSTCSSSGQGATPLYHLCTGRIGITISSSIFYSPL